MEKHTSILKFGFRKLTCVFLEKFDGKSGAILLSLIDIGCVAGAYPSDNFKLVDELAFFAHFVKLLSNYIEFKAFIILRDKISQTLPYFNKIDAPATPKYRQVVQIGQKTGCTGNTSRLDVQPIRKGVGS